MQNWPYIALARGSSPDVSLRDWISAHMVTGSARVRDDAFAFCAEFFDGMLDEPLAGFEVSDLEERAKEACQTANRIMAREDSARRLWVAA